MSFTLPQLRQAIEAELVTRLPTWTVSRLSYELFPGADAMAIVARAFAVGLGDREFLPRGRGGLATTMTQVLIRFTSILRADDHVTSLDEALTLEAALVVAVAAIGNPPVTLIGSSGSVVGDGTVYLGELRTTVLHAYPTT